MLQFGPKITEEIKYDIAWMYCLTLSYEGYKDWRLPTSNEYMGAPFSFSWYEDRPFQPNTAVEIWFCQPVRDA